MKRTILYISILLSLSYQCVAMSQRDSASMHYQNENYQQAIDTWTSILENENKSPEVLYNLGNAYYKSGDFANAVLFYERASLLSPEDEDIQHNLQVVQTKLKDQVEAIPELFFIVWLNQLNLWISGTAWGICSILLFSLFLALLLWRFFKRKAKGKRIIIYTSVLALFISLICLMLALRSESLKHKSNSAIIMKDALIKSSPSETGINLFEVHEGLKIELTDSVNGFSEIRLSDGKKGWISSEKIESI